MIGAYPHGTSESLTLLTSGVNFSRIRASFSIALIRILNMLKALLVGIVPGVDSTFSTCSAAISAAFGVK